LLSPFSVVDTALKGFRTTVLASVVGTSFLGDWSGHPWFGAIWSLVIIVFSYFIAGWSFRLSHLGFVFVWDFIALRRRRFQPGQSANWMFLARQINKVPARSYGKLLRDEKGSLVLKYRPWLVLPERVLVLPEGRYAIGKGLFYSQIMKENGQGLTAAMLLPPRYRGHEEDLVSIYGLAGVRDAGLRATFRWLMDLLGFRPQPA
jgi:hypothetical protein